MNIDENLDNSNNANEEITIKIRAMDKEFEIKIDKSSTIKALKEKISQVINIFFNLIKFFFFINFYNYRITKFL